MILARLEPSKREEGGWLAYWEDGSFLLLDEGDVVRFALYAGMEVSDSLHEALQEASIQRTVRVKALEFLSRRPMSKRELVEKLTAHPRERGKPPLAGEPLAEEVAAWLEELGYLNDAEYARTVVRHYASKGYGERKLRDELYRRGVPRALWEDALAETPPPEAEIDAFLQKRFRNGTPDRKELKRAGDALARRGYRWEEIREGLNRLGAEADVD